MSHKFKVGDKVKVAIMTDDSIPLYQQFTGTITLLAFLSSRTGVPTYEVKVGYIYYTVHEEGLEKIEEPKLEPKYKIGDKINFTLIAGSSACRGTIKNIARAGQPVFLIYPQKENKHNTILSENYYIVEIKPHSDMTYQIKENQILNKVEENKQKYEIGDRVIFYVTEDEVMVGHIDHIRNWPLYSIGCGDSYFQIHEKYIIGKSEYQTKESEDLTICEIKSTLHEEFKEGDEVWVRAKVSPWDGVFFHGALRNSTNEISINFLSDHENVWINKNDIVKSLPIKPTNEWISVNDRLPKNKDKIHVLGFFGNQFIGRYNEDDKLVWCAGDFCLRMSLITHWKPLDAPPE